MSNKQKAFWKIINENKKNENNNCNENRATALEFNELFAKIEIRTAADIEKGA